MKPILIYRGQQKLDGLFKKVGNLGDDLELQSHWAKYLCILVSGWIETSIRTIYIQYARKQSPEFIGNFIEYTLGDFQNPKMTKILELARSFNPDWEERLRKETDGERKDAIDSIVNNRHRVAHGEPSDITYARIATYYKKAIEVVDLVSAQCSE
jgi:hypothetical protein